MGAQLKFGISQKFFVLGLSPATVYAHRRFPSLLTKGLIITSLLHATEVYVKYIITVHDMMIAEWGVSLLWLVYVVLVLNSIHIVFFYLSY